MIPVPSSELVEGRVLPPDDRTARKFQDWARGGVALQDTSAGMDFQDWIAYWEDGTGRVLLSASNQPEPIEIYQVDDLAWLTIAFDQNMRWLSSYTLEDGQSYLKWYDSFLGDYTTEPLPVGILTPFLTTDDRRKKVIDLGLSDVILTYIRDGALYVRVQRERFLMERLIAADIQGSTRIWHFGMNDKLRLQWELR